MHPSPPPGTVRAPIRASRWPMPNCAQINTKMWKWLHCHPYNDMLGDGLPEDERTWALTSGDDADCLVARADA